MDFQLWKPLVRATAFMDLVRFRLVLGKVGRGTAEVPLLFSFPAGLF